MCLHSIRTFWQAPKSNLFIFIRYIIYSVSTRYFRAEVYIYFFPSSFCIYQILQVYIKQQLKLKGSKFEKKTLWLKIPVKWKCSKPKKKKKRFAFQFKGNRGMKSISKSASSCCLLFLLLFKQTPKNQQHK